MKRLWALVLPSGVVFSAPAWAGQQSAEEGGRPVVHAVRLNPDERISIDGTLDEPSWERAESAADFRQFEPRNGEPATERTEIRIVFDRDNLYIGGSSSIPIPIKP